MTKRVVTVAEVDPSFVELVAADDQFDLLERICTTVDDLREAVRDAHVVVSRAYTPLSAAVIGAAPELELIIQGTSGVDNIDLDAAAARGVRVISTPGANANAVAELVIGLMLSMTRTIPFYDATMKQGQWQRAGCATRHELAHHDVGIIGIGRVGTRVARHARGFGCMVRAFDPYLDGSEIEARGATKVDSLEELLAVSRIVTLHVPLTAETRSMIGADELALLPPGSFLINTSRGEVVDADAVVNGIESGRLAGAALDVFDPEPPTRQWPSDPRLILTPHIAGCTAEAKSDAGARMYEELRAFYEGR